MSYINLESCIIQIYGNIFIVCPIVERDFRLNGIIIQLIHLNLLNHFHFMQSFQIMLYELLTEDDFVFLTFGIPSSLRCIFLLPLKS